MENSPHKKTIVFARWRPDFRIFKIALALKRIGGYYTVLLSEKNYDKTMFADAFDEVVTFKSFLRSLLYQNNVAVRLLRAFVHAVRELAYSSKAAKVQKMVMEESEHVAVSGRMVSLIRKLEKKADVFHAVTEPNFMPELIMRHTKKPVVYDVYDFSGIRFGVSALTSIEQERERYCLEHASGISMKFPPSILEYYKNLGYKITCPILTFIDYCLPEFFSWQDKQPDPSNIHVVYAGITSSMKESPLYSGNNQYLDIIKSIIAQKIHFHLYASPLVVQYPDLYSDYYDLAKQNKYFIMHESKGQPELQRELAQYDFGIILNDFAKTKITKLFEETSFGNKYSTYLESGLPMIVNENLKLNTEYVEKYGVGFRINPSRLSELSSLILQQDYQIFKNNVTIAREGPLNIYNNISKLTEFYDSLV